MQPMVPSLAKVMTSIRTRFVYHYHYPSIASLQHTSSSSLFRRWLSAPPAAPSVSGNMSGQTSPSPRARHFFYSIDDHGRLFLADVKIRNIATCLKDGKFLDFFFTHIQSTRRLLADARGSTDSGSGNKRLQRLTEGITDDMAKKWPWISICGNELNFVQCDTTPIVYNSLRPATGAAATSVTITPPTLTPGSTPIVVPATTATGDYVLGYAHSLTIPFEPTSLRVDASTGKLFHPSPPSIPGLALLKSSLALELGSGMRAGCHSYGWQLQWQGRLLQIPEC
jgi:hypothetical protein